MIEFRSHRILAPLLALGLVSLAPPTLACRANDDAALKVREVVEGLVAADNERDIGHVLEYYATDAVLLPPNEQPVTDRDEIQRRYVGLFESFTPQIEARVDEICVDDTLAVVRGHNGGWMVTREGGLTRQLDDVYLMVLRLETSGDWKISRLMWHSGSPTPR